MFRVYQRRRKLPEDMLEEVILRLPAKDVAKLRLLSKAWKSRLSSAGFVRAHSKYHMNRGGHEIIISNSRCKWEPLFICPAGGGSVRQVTSPLFGESCARPEASCYGFVVVEIKIGKEKRSKEKRMLLFNPTTQNAIEIPPVKSSTPEESRYFLGLGYDSFTDDYKIVRLSESDEFYGTFVDVYSFKMKTWKSLGESRYHVYDVIHGDGVFINGCLHWRARDIDHMEKGHITVGFDLAKEEFKEVPSPKRTSDNSTKRSDDSSGEDSDDDSDDSYEEDVDLASDNSTKRSDDSSEGDSDDDSDDSYEEEDVDDTSFQGFTSESGVAVFGGGCLVVMTNPSGKNYIEIWVMREYGVQESWMKLVIANDEGIDFDDPEENVEYDPYSGVFNFICLSGKDKLIFEKCSTEENGFPFMEYSLRTGRWQGVVVRDEQIQIDPSNRVVTYRECLLSPDLL